MRKPENLGISSCCGLDPLSYITYIWHLCEVDLTVSIFCSEQF
jgi:hypothetical protein